MKNKAVQNYINHIILVLDASGSMLKWTKDLIKVADNQVAYLAQRSKELDQETRITIYSFSTGQAECLVYDKDVLRMPSIADLYKPTRWRTALIDATLLSLSDLALTPQRYGDHSFLIYVLTDGAENDSVSRPSDLSSRLSKLDDNWTVATFVPNQTGVHEAKRFGFLPGNISVWDATSAAGFEAAGEEIRRTTESFMQARSRGVRGSRNLFSLADVSASDVTAQLQDVGDYHLVDVKADERIDVFCQGEFGRYHAGHAFYELMKSETIQPQKDIAILQFGKVYRGAAARKLLGLPDYSVRVRPSDHQFKVFVQSTSINRKLIAGTQLLVFD